jgi:EAL domain-containing protein (putative c-di-GMP-specific phosphodiesterase class I)
VLIHALDDHLEACGADWRLPGWGIDRDDGAIVSAIIAMAHKLKVQVVAEGVEKVKQLEFLRLRQCDLIQGFLVSPPLQAKDVAPGYAIGSASRRRAASRW